MIVAILGATSQIAKDLIILFAAETNKHLHLFARSPDEVTKWLVSVGLAGHYPVDNFSNFGKQTFDAVINFVGVGDPALAKAMGSKIFDITFHYDMMALSYLEHHPHCKYIFLSSGAVYGGDFGYPATQESHSTININNLKSTDWYTIAKLYAEARHRALPAFNIIDIRVFNYFSHTQNPESRFLITDVIRAIKSHEVFYTSVNNITRDFITPPDFFNLVQCILNLDSRNLAVDCYTQAPIDKLSLLSELSIQFGLRYIFQIHDNIVNATRIKVNYYSLNKLAEEIGYIPSKNSLSGLINEFQHLNLCHNA